MSRRSGSADTVTTAILSVLLALFAIHLRPAAAETVNLQLEHAFGGGVFTTAGQLVGDLDGQVSSGRGIILNHSVDNFHLQSW